MRVHTFERSHAPTSTTSSGPLSQSVAHCFDCAEACTSCAHACMESPSKNRLERCIRLNLECADLCFAAGTLASQPAQFSLDQLLTALERAADACKVCAEECERQAGGIDSCVGSAEACHSCREALRAAMHDAGGGTGTIQTN